MMKQHEERQAAIREARGACYQLAGSEVYQEAYAIIAGKYSIARESERRGFIETEWVDYEDYNGNVYSERASIEVLENRNCTRLVIKSETESQGQVSPNVDAADNLYLEIHPRIAQSAAAGAPAPAPAAPAPAPAAPAPQ